MTNDLFNIHERIKHLREDILNINQNEMSIRIGMKQGSLSDIERKRTKTVTDRVINDICREFNVNEDWLRCGQGDIIVETKESFISGLSKQYDLDNLDIALLESYISLTVKDRGVIKKYVHSVFETLNDEIATTTDEETVASINIDEEVESYRLELLAEQKGEILSVSEGIGRKVN